MKALWELISVMSSMKEEEHGSMGVAYSTVMKSGSGGQEKCSWGKKLSSLELQDK